MFQDSLTKKIAEAAAKIKTEVEIVDVNEKSVEGAVSKIMSEKLVGDQHKIDANKNNKVDAHDFKLLRAQKEKEKANSQKFGKAVKEESEQIDEISKTTLNNYLKGVKKENDPRIHGDSAGSGNQMSNKARSLGRTEQDKEDGRYEGQKLAKRKLGAPGTIPAKVMAREETEQIDELLKQDTKKSFIASKMNDDDSTKSKAEFTNKTKGFTLDAAKSSLKNKIKSAHHDKYDIDNTSSFDHAVKKYHKAKMAGHINEEAELDEAMFPGTKEYEKKYGQSPQQKLKKVGDTEKTAQGEMKKTEKGVMHTRRFSEMISAYQEEGLKYINSLVKEEPSQEEFEKEVDVQKKRNSGEIRNDKGVAKAFQSASVREEPVNPVREDAEIQVINADIANGVKIDNIEERSLTEPEMKKKEEIVKSMKKGMAGFKERYGDRAKEVMYATATARAKGE